MRNLTPYLLAPVLAVGLAAAANAQPAACGDPVVGLIERMTVQMRVVAEDVPIEVPDMRGQALSAEACDILEQLRHMQREARQVGPEHMREEAVELDQKFHRFIETAEALGPQGRYLSRRAERVELLDHELLSLLSGAAPAPVVQPPAPQAYPPGVQQPYGPTGLSTSYRWWAPPFRRW